MLAYWISFVAKRRFYVSLFKVWCLFADISAKENTKNGTGTAIMTTCLQLIKPEQKAAAVLNVSVYSDSL